MGNRNRSDFGVSLYLGSERKQVSEDWTEFPNVDEFRRIGGEGVRKCLREFTDFEGPVCKGGLRAVPDVGKRPLPLWQ